MSLVTPTGERASSRGSYDIKIPNIRLVGPRLLVAPARAVESRTSTGVIIPEAAQDHSQKGLVLLTGDGALLDGAPWVDGQPQRVQPIVSPGWEVIFARYAGVQIELDGSTYFIIQESDVRAVLTYAGLHFLLDEATPRSGGSVAASTA